MLLLDLETNDSDEESVLTGVHGRLKIHSLIVAMSIPFFILEKVQIQI